MKVIPVAGTSGSGKTTFIRDLLPLLARYGPVGTVKHIGHHTMEVAEGKDTTVMFDAGARAVAGIDREKIVITLRSTSVTDALDILAGQGVAFAVVEGFKGSPWPKVVIGDLGAEACVLHNPAPEDVIQAFGRFPDYITHGEILRELATGCRGTGRPCILVTAVIPVPAVLNGPPPSSIEEELSALVRGTEALSGVIAARAALRQGSIFGGTDELLVAVAAESGEEAALALQFALPGCLEELEGP